MATPAIPVEDQDDDDFFDKLVDDEVLKARADSGFRENFDNIGAQVLANSIVDEVDAELDGLDTPLSVEGDDKTGVKDDVSLHKLDSKKPNVIEANAKPGDKDDITHCEIGGKVEENESVQTVGGVIEHDDHAKGADHSEFDSASHSNDANTSGGVKEVQWSAFSGGIAEESYSDFFSGMGDSSIDPFAAVASDTQAGALSNQGASSSSYSFDHGKDDIQHVSSTQQTSYGLDHGSATEMLDHNSIEYWESLYPGWKYDPITGEWRQLDGSNSTDAQVLGGAQSDVYYFQQTGQSSSTSEAYKTENLSYWNQTTAGSSQYPAHMVFDSQYPGWYYDTIAQEWRSLDSYISSRSQSVSSEHNQQMCNSGDSVNYYSEQTITYRQTEQVNLGGTSAMSHQWRDMDRAQLEPFGESKDISPTHNSQSGVGFMSGSQGGYSVDGKTGLSGKSTLYEQSSQGFNGGNMFNGFQRFDQQFSSNYFTDPKISSFRQQHFQHSAQPSVSNEGRSSAGRPPHALVTFGFGGKLIIMRDTTSLQAQPQYASQDSAGFMINVFNMMEVAMVKSDITDASFSACDYLCSLCQQSYPSPLVLGTVGAKELNKWIDERISNFATQALDYRKAEALKILFSLLKIACQFYGKLRSAFGTDLMVKGHDCPESALAKLFSSANGNQSQFRSDKNYLQNIPSVGQLQATASQVQMLLVSGRRIEALQCAQAGQLWGPAIVIAALLGDQFYGETVKQMALHQLVAGSPLRTLCLLLAGQPAEVFSNPTTSNVPSGVHFSQPVQVGVSCMLDEWEENLAIITANRTNGDELVITHLGDCLWKERGEVIAAHVCYLVAEANVEPYSESARICLVGADHLKCPRTHASPEAILRTELYEYAKVLGNSQFILLPFQPYKLIYATMLAEVGKLSDSLKYCQALLKSLKAGRSPEVDSWRYMVSSLDERIRNHQQGGYATNLAPTKLFGKLLNFFDNTAHRVVGGLPPPVPSPSPTPSQHKENDHLSRMPQMSTSQSTMAMSSLMPSASMEESRSKLMHNRSISEPNIGRTPRKDGSPEKLEPSASNDNPEIAPNSSRFGRFGSQIFQKTLGLVLKARSDKQAKLGETNKFYYDEKLKRWVEEGAQPPAEEPALAPPPTTAAFLSGKPDHDKKDGSFNNTIANGQPELKSSSSPEKNPGTPPLPSGEANQFSARGRLGVRARYVDTFNKGGAAQPNLFKSPSPSNQATKPAIGNAKFFIPTPFTSQETDTTQNSQEALPTEENTPISNCNQSFSSSQTLSLPPITPPGFNRHPSMERLPNKGKPQMTNGYGNMPEFSRRTSSWSEALGDNDMSESRTRKEVSGFPPSSAVIPGNASQMMPFSSSSEDLQEVQL